MGFHTLLNNLLHPVRVLPPEEAYRLWAPNYDDRSNNAVLFVEEQTVLPLLSQCVLPGKKIVDFGCGTGRHILHCLELGATNIVGIDLSSPMLMMAASKPGISSTSLVQARMEQIPFADSSFDLGIEALALSHLRNIDRAVCEMARVLRSSGILLLSDLHWSFSDRGWQRTFKSILAPSDRLAVQNYSHGLDEYLEAFEKAHLIVEETITPRIDHLVRPFFVKAGMAGIYERYEGQPLLIVFQLRKQ